MISEKKQISLAICLLINRQDNFIIALHYKNLSKKVISKYSFSLTHDF